MTSSCVCIQQDSLSQVWDVVDEHHVYATTYQALMHDAHKKQQKLSETERTQLLKKAFEHTVTSLIHIIREQSPHIAALLHVEVKEQSEGGLIPAFRLTFSTHYTLPSSFDPQEIVVKKYIMAEPEDADVLKDMGEELMGEWRPSYTDSLSTAVEPCFIQWTLEAHKDNGHVAWKKTVTLMQQKISSEVHMTCIPHKPGSVPSWDMIFGAEASAGACPLHLQLAEALTPGLHVTHAWRFPRTAVWGKLAGKQATLHLTCNHIWPAVPQDVDEETASYRHESSRDQWVAHHKQRLTSYAHEMTETAFQASLMTSLVRHLGLTVSDDVVDKAHQMDASLQHLTAELTVFLKKQYPDDSTVDTQLRLMQRMRFMTSAIVEGLLTFCHVTLSPDVLRAELEQVMRVSPPSPMSLKDGTFVTQEVKAFKQRQVVKALSERVVTVTEVLPYGLFESVIEKELLGALETVADPEAIKDSAATSVVGSENYASFGSPI